jgi:Cof subfamily protein (haloacid dehalogenase superfamily)
VLAPSHPIELVVTDVDGTLLNSKQELDECVLDSIRSSQSKGVPLMIATGKAIGPWTETILPALDSPMPQIFLQGLFIRDGRDGATLYSNALDRDVLLRSISLAEQLGVTLVLYSSDRILCKSRNYHTDRLIFYGEPTPEAVGDVAGYIDAHPEVDIHKVIFMSEEDSINLNVRPLVESELRNVYDVALTSAIEGMVEVLPPGASKGKGVEFVLHLLGLSPENVMALGDGENDAEMLKLVGWGVAVGNAGDKARQAANVVSQYTNDLGAVGKAIDEYVLTQ